MGPLLAGGERGEKERPELSRAAEALFLESLPQPGEMRRYRPKELQVMTPSPVDMTVSRSVLS